MYIYKCFAINISRCGQCTKTPFKCSLMFWMKKIILYNFCFSILLNQGSKNVCMRH